MILGCYSTRVYLLICFIQIFIIVNTLGFLFLLDSWGFKLANWHSVHGLCFVVLFMCCVHNLWKVLWIINFMMKYLTVTYVLLSNWHTYCVSLRTIETHRKLHWSGLLSSFRIQTDSLTKTEQQLFYVHVIALCVMDRDCVLLALCKSWICIKVWLFEELFMYLPDTDLILSYPSSPQSLCLEHWLIIKL